MSVSDDWPTRAAAVRRQLAGARSELKTKQDYLHDVRLRAELRLLEQIVDANGVADTKRLGTNAEDRKRAFDAAVEQDDDCRMALDNVRALEHTVFSLEAELDVLLDLRRTQEMLLRLRTLDMLERGVSADSLSVIKL